jgi:hypothetical protein
MRIAHVVEWDRAGQSCIALIVAGQIVARFDNWTDAKAAYKAARS